MAGTKRCAGDGKIIRNTVLKVPLHPTEEQAALFDKTFDCCRYIWNRILADEQEFYAATGEHFLPTPAKYKAEAPFLKEVDSQGLAHVHQSLRQAFQSFFSDPEHYGYPRFKGKNCRKNSYTTFCQYFTSGPTVYVTGDGVRLPKAGIVKANHYRRALHWWKLKSATVSRSPAGKYYCSLLYEYAAKEPETVKPDRSKTVGLNYSLPHFYVDSDGYSPDPPHWLAQSQEKLAAMQRKLSRMVRGSNNYNEQLQKIRNLQEHIANQRRDFLHKESRRVADRNDAVCVRESNLQEISQTIKLGNALDAGFGEFRTSLRYKLERQGKPYIVVDKWIPTAKTCNTCGFVNEDLPREAKTWTCPACGAVHSREENAARNIRDQGLAKLE